MAGRSKKKDAEGENLPAAVTPGGKLIKLPQDPQKFFGAMQANLGNITLTSFDLDRIKVPTGGGLAWTVPDLEGPKVMEALNGVIIATKTARAFWKVPFDQSGGGSPPDCSSDDAIVGVGEPGGECALCPYAEWGSKGGDQDESRGQACKQIILLYLVLQDSQEMLPKVVVLPPTSIKATRQFLLRLASRGLATYMVQVKLGLEPDKNKQGIAYSKITPSMTEKLPPEDQSIMANYVHAVGPLLGTWRPDDFKTD